MKALVNIRTAWKLVFVAMLTVSLAIAPRAVAEDPEGVEADIPDSSTLADTEPANQVLEIPQQCDQASVAVLCDRSSSESSASSDPNTDAPDGTSVASDPNVGSVYDYANQNITSEASAAGTMNVPVGIYAPGYPVLSPAPRIVSSGPIGAGSYQQWAAGPGAYQQFAPGPGYIASPPLGYHPSGFGSGFGGGRFGRR
jgi:hypothetical protein